MGHTPNYLNSKPHPMAIMHVVSCSNMQLVRLYYQQTTIIHAPRASAEGIIIS